MTFLSIAARIVLVTFVLGIGACSSTEDSLVYGYEENFVVPEPDMVPVTPDDKPGRTVDEMLNLTSPAVTVKKKEDKPSERVQVYEHAGRFGSKEKISLRKGLNAPDSGVLYGSQKRREAQEVRALEVKKQEKDEFQAMSEEEMLSGIIAPKATKLELIEVVSAPAGKKAEESGHSLPSLTVSADSNEVIVSKSVSFEPAHEKEENIVLLKPPAVSKNEKTGVKNQEEASFVLLKPAEVQEKIVLMPPQEDVILLKKPELSESDSSVEIFLDE